MKHTKETFRMKRKTPTIFSACMLIAFVCGPVFGQDDFGELFGDDNNGREEAEVREESNDWGAGVGEADREAPAAPAPEDIDPEVRRAEALERERQERIRIEARVAEGRRNFADGERAMREGRWAVAVDLFDEALAKFKDVPDLADIRERARRNKSESYYQMAVRLYNRRHEGADLDRARRFLDDSESTYPGLERVPELREAIAEYERRVIDGREEIRIEDEERYRTAREEIDRLLARGRRELEIGDYDTAKATFDRVLAHDRYNRDALRMLERVAEEVWEARRVERRTSVMEMMAEGERRWLQPRAVDRRGPRELADPTADPVEPAAVELERRLSEIVIPEIRFQSAHISDVISFLVQASREADPDGIGVNIIFMDPTLAEERDGAPAQPRARDRAPADDPFARLQQQPGRERDREPAALGRIPPISLEVRNVTLLDALELVTDIAGLYYRVERNIVVIERRGRGQLVTRFYSVDPTLFTQRTQAIQPGRGRERDRGDPFGGDPFGSREQQDTGEEPDLRAIFERYGVRIPSEGEIAYDPLVAQLVVTLTPDQFDQFEEVLRVINVQPRQVQIEARFVEVLQRDLEQLGFEWILTDDAEVLVQDGPGPVGSRPRIQMDQQPNGFTGALRFFDFDPVSQSTTPQTRRSDEFNPLGDIMSLRGVLTNPELQMVVHAIDQRGNSDLLSAPRVTTVNGVNAIIEVVNEIIYPTDFDVQQQDLTIFGGTQGDQQGFGAGVFVPPTVIPGGFETRQIGVILNVTPTVSADNYTINLTMLPEIAELVDWIQYGSQIPVGGEVFTVNMPQPVFASRSVTTSMIVWDGHTVVMGGLIREDLTRYKDKVPLLGDIPLLGRLFRSEGTRSEKRNLLIFVTASLVDPSGNPLNMGDRDLTTRGMGGGGIQTTGGMVQP